jgi:hypothetical protein
MQPDKISEPRFLKETGVLGQGCANHLELLYNLLSRRVGLLAGLVGAGL